MGDFLPFHSYHSKKKQQPVGLGHLSWQKQRDHFALPLEVILQVAPILITEPSFLKEDTFVTREPTWMSSLLAAPRKGPFTHGSTELPADTALRACAEAGLLPHNASSSQPRT